MLSEAASLRPMAQRPQTQNGHQRATPTICFKNNTDTLSHSTQHGLPCICGAPGCTNERAPFVSFLKFYLFILSLTVLGLSLVSASGSYSLIAVRQFLIAVASLLQSSGSR